MFNWLKKSESIKSLGQLGEEAAQEEYERCGFKIIAQNEYNKKGKRLGEIDFIAVDKNRIVFVEVKTRNLLSVKFGTGAEAVDQFKQIKILKAVKIFLQKHPEYAKLQPQIDVCVMEYSEVDPVRGRPAAGSGTATAASGRLASNGVDKSFKPAKIIANAVEDWN